jgi:glycerol dehydrogenase
MQYVEQFDRDFGIADRVAIITGAAQGIGRAIAELYAAKGATLVLVDLKSNVEDAAEAVRALGAQAVAITADLTQSASIRMIVERSVEEFGRIDILVNNAGIVLLEDAETLPADYWDSTMAINLRAPFLLAQAVGRQMIGAGGGKIINMASQAGLVALDKHVAYSASKAGIISMTKTLAVEWGEFNINVNCISPTVIMTELGKKAWAGEVGERFQKKIPAGRFGFPQEVAAVALFLASDAANLITGENVVIDGGYTAQ